MRAIHPRDQLCHHLGASGFRQFAKLRSGGIGIHAMQGLPLLALMLAAIPRLKAAPLVQLGAVLWLAFTGFAFAQALRGIALF
jgi:hypothetical protein